MVFFGYNSNFTEKFRMFEASFSDVLEVILIILLIYFGFKIMLRWFGPLILKFFLKKVGKQFEKKFGQSHPFQGQPRKETGEVQLDKKPGKKRKSNNDVGEYIDYEEID